MFAYGSKRIYEGCRTDYRGHGGKIHVTEGSPKNRKAPRKEPIDLEKEE